MGHYRDEEQKDDYLIIAYIINYILNRKVLFIQWSLKRMSLKDINATFSHKTGTRETIGSSIGQRICSIQAFKQHLFPKLFEAKIKTGVFVEPQMK